MGNKVRGESENASTRWETLREVVGISRQDVALFAFAVLVAL